MSGCLPLLLSLLLSNNVTDLGILLEYLKVQHQDGRAPPNCSFTFSYPCTLWSSSVALLIHSIKEALTGAEVVIIPAGVPRKPGMT